jgi:peptidoglycan/xylan/chitin deacetylase (PgdA/CDA1 family)
VQASRGSWKFAARTALRKSGGLHLARWMKRKQLRILMYHRFPDAAGLERQCRHLAKCYRVISLSEAAEALRAGRELAANSLVVTVDDGYRDVYQVAWPIFAASRIPAMVYVVTGFLSGELWLWTDQVQYAFENARSKAVRIELPGSEPWEFALRSEGERRAAELKIMEALKLVSNEERLRALGRLAELLEVEIPDEPPPGFEPLRWSEVREMARGGLEFGAHTRRHPVLSRVSSAAELADEIAGSKHCLEELLGSPVRHFCYPNGLRRDISAEAVEMVRQAGYETAVTTEAGVNGPGDDLLRLRRIGVDPGYEPEYFQQCAAAFRV